MARQPFQDSVEHIVESLGDPLRLYEEAIQVNSRLTAAKASGIGGGLHPQSRALYRAVVIGSVAAWEAFNEELLEAGYNVLRTNNSEVPELLKWWRPRDLATPNSYNIRKYYWQYFGFNPLSCWTFDVSVRVSEVGESGKWWRAFNDAGISAQQRLTDKAAAKWLDDLVKLRHANAHHDLTNYRDPPSVGVASYQTGKQTWGVAQYHALNAIAVIAQLALCTATGLSVHLGINPKLRASARLNEWRLHGSTLPDLRQWP